MLRLTSVALLLLGLSVDHAQAGLLILNYAGKTTAGASAGGTAIDPGTNFEIHASFDSTPFITTPLSDRVGQYHAVEIHALVTGTGYVDLNPSLFDVYFRDFGPSQSYYGTGLVDAHQFFGGTYSSSTHEFNSAAASPTEFSGWQNNGDVFTTLRLATASGSLVLSYDISVGIGASVTASAVPEPSSIVMLASGAAGLLGYGLQRRQRSRA